MVLSFHCWCNRVKEQNYRIAVLFFGGSFCSYYLHLMLLMEWARWDGWGREDGSLSTLLSVWLLIHLWASVHAQFLSCRVPLHAYVSILSVEACLNKPRYDLLWWGRWCSQAARQAFDSHPLLYVCKCLFIVHIDVIQYCSWKQVI